VVDLPELDRRDVSESGDVGFDALRSRRCECGAADCNAVVRMSWEEQDAVDHVSGRWAVAPGHVLRGAASSRVVAETDRYVVFEAVEEHDL
jgi:hypothetical protein